MTDVEQEGDLRVYRRPVLVDGTYQGYEMEHLPLGALRPPLEEVYVETSSGNVYAIYVPEREEGKIDFAIMGLKGNEGKGKQARGSYLNDQDMQLGALDIGSSFHYGSGNTSEVTNITFLTGKNYGGGTPEHLAQLHTRGNMSNIRSEFWRKVGK